MLATRKTALILVSLSLIIFAATVQASQAADYTKVGVKVGDTADYSVSATGAGSGYASGAMHLEVQSVSGTTITIKLSGTGIPGNATPSGDISTGSGALFPFVIAANLATSDAVYSGAIWSISGSATMNVAGQSRTVNQMSYSVTILTITVSYSVNWDKATGLFVGLNMTFGTAASVSIAMTSTSLWSAGLFGLSTGTLLLIGVGVVIIIGIAVALKRRK